MVMCYVYLIRCSGSTFYKIGVANDVGDRMANLQSGCPYLLELIMTCGFHTKTAAIGAEQAAHRNMAKYRMHGEWFDLPDALAESVMRDMIWAE